MATTQSINISTGTKSTLKNASNKINFILFTAAWL